MIPGAQPLANMGLGQGLSSGESLQGKAMVHHSCFPCMSLLYPFYPHQVSAQQQLCSRAMGSACPVTPISHPCCSEPTAGQSQPDVSLKIVVSGAALRLAQAPSTLPGRVPLLSLWSTFPLSLPVPWGLASKSMA